LTLSYGAYVTPVTTTGTASTPLEYAGQYIEPETGLIYLRARSYDPATAQFTTRDPAFAAHTQRHWYELPVQAEQIHNELVAEYRPLLHELRHTASVVGAADAFGEDFEKPETFAAQPIREDARDVYREY
jgi:RHS repeat-associated protein